MRRLVLALPLALALAPPLPAQQPQLVAPTDPLTPEQERKALVVPAGFEVQLVASEPDIQKPMQLAFDAKGRIWLTTSYHYPFAAEKGKATDRLYVLSDFGPDGKAKKVQVFADFLNIPIGILPLPDCNSCIVSSVGEILKLTDADGDGKCDKKEVLFTGFGTRDTHGMYNSYTLMPDGWVYACHGFANDSTVRGKDGHEVKMNSGNTFRFRPDGSRIEVYTRGQVNPFGMTVDPWFNLYTADCHSKPITQLIPGAYYQSFGKPHDGLGFAPHVTRHDHGSTGLCGLAWYDADHFPKEYRGTMFLGNVVTSRINLDRIEWKGSTPVAKEMPDFVVSKDPWFRPVDIKLGPDGALYVSDFYNKIIGHYEVDLKHPARDKERGRLWRIVWTGKGGKAPPPKMPFTDLTKEAELTKDPEVLMKLWKHPNLTVRLLLTQEHIRNRFEGGIGEGRDPAALWEYALQICHLGWGGYRAGLLSAEDISQVIGGDQTSRFGPDGFQLVQVHAARVFSDTPEHTPNVRSALREMLAGKPRVARAAAEAVAAHPHPDFVKPLVELIQKVPAEDTHLRHAARIALRNCLRDAEGGWKAAPAPTAAGSAVVADVALGIPSPLAANYLTQTVIKGNLPKGRLSAAAEHIGRYEWPQNRDKIIEYVVKSSGEPDEPINLLQGLVRGIQARGDSPLGEANANRVLKRLRTELESGRKGTQLATLKLLADMPSILPRNYTSRGAAGVDPAPALTKLIGDVKEAGELRGEALATLTKLDPGSGLTSAVGLIDSPQTTTPLREKAAMLLATSADRSHKQAARDAIQSVPYRSATVIATALAGSRDGAEILFDAVKQGKASPRLLQEKLVLERLRAARVENLDQRVAELTKGLPPADQKLTALVKQRAATFASAKADKALGQKLFTQHCATCHRIGDEGGKVGPQLDGVGIRGLERLLEDVLDPNRNVDQAFRARVLNLVDGTIKTGLMLRVEGEVVVFADDQGKELRIPKDEIESNRETALSPMPANVAETIPEADFFHLMAYLLDQKVKDVPKKE